MCASEPCSFADCVNVSATFSFAKRALSLIPLPSVRQELLLPIVVTYTMRAHTHPEAKCLVLPLPDLATWLLHCLSYRLIESDAGRCRHHG